MALKRKDYPNFIYYWYQRLEFRDSLSLKRELGGLQLIVGEQRDIVIDFAACNGLISAELSVMVRILSSFHNSPRFLRIIVNPKVNAALEAVNLTKLGNLVVYTDQKQFVEAVKAAKNTP